VFIPRSRNLLRVFNFRQTARTLVLDLLGRVHDFDDRVFVESVQQAGQPGWAAIIPIVNFYFLCKVARRPGWWLLLMLIPFVNVIILIIIDIDIAKNFGKGVGFGIGLILLPFIFFPILAFGSARYQGTPPPPAPV
jgi:hypothetical protein